MCTSKVLCQYQKNHKFTHRSRAALDLYISSVHDRAHSFFKNGVLEEITDSYFLLTQALPSVGSDLILALSKGSYVNNSPFRSSDRSPLPALFIELLLPIFDRSGYIRENVDAKHIIQARQCLMTYYKFVLPFKDSVREDAYTKFIELDKQVKTDHFLNIDLIKPIFLSLLPDNPWDIRPRYSSGATNTANVDNYAKREINRIDKNIALSPYASLLYGRLKTRDPVVMPRIVKFTLVPKDSRGPRGISMEPHENMALALGVYYKIIDHQERYCNISRGRINYRDQRINQSAAYLGSVFDTLSTIDLKDASDLISWPLIEKLLEGTDWQYAINILRATHVDVGGSVIELNKFGNMGSPLTFVMLATTIFSIISANVTDNLYVYGDDVIVPAIYAEQSCHALEAYGLAINWNKSFIKGPFKESCGADFYKGSLVNYTKCKSHDYNSFIEFANLIGETLDHDVSFALVRKYEELNKIIVFRAEVGTEPIGFVFRTPYSLASNDVFFKKRYNNDLHRYEYRILANKTISIQPMTESYIIRNYQTNPPETYRLLTYVIPQKVHVSVAKGVNHLYEWLCLKETNSPVENSVYDLNNHTRSKGALNFESAVTISKARTKPSFTWLDSCSFSTGNSYH